MNFFLPNPTVQAFEDWKDLEEPLVVAFRSNTIILQSMSLSI